MANTSISGLVSGLDTATIIDQLMQLEATSQTRLKTRQTTEKSVLTALQSLNTDLASLATRAATLAKPTTWQSLAGTSSSPLVSVTTGTGATPTSFSVTVDQVATAAQTAWTEDTALGANVVTGPVTLTAADGTSHTIATGTGSLADLVTGINAAKAGVTATAVRTGTDATGTAVYRLQVTGDTTGAASTIGLAGTSLTVSGSSAGTDAQVRVGSQGIVATSRTNTFTDLTPGVSITLGAGVVAGGTTPTTATVTVAQDSATTKASVKALVDQVNALLTTIDTRSANGTSTTPAGALSGESAVRSVRDALASTVFGGASGTTLASVGIQTDRYGKLVLDEAAFDKAYAADPAGTAAQFTGTSTTDPTTGVTTTTTGWAGRVAAVAKSASDAYTGTITAAVTGRQSSIDRLGDDIAAWDDRLALRRTTLQQTYTALETALSGLQSQGNWLAGQIAQLPTSS